MKTVRFILFLCAAMLVSAACSSSSVSTSKEEKEKLSEGIKAAINSNTYKIEIDQMLPANAPSKMLTYGYSIEIKNDSVFSYLPYFGRAYSAPYGGENPMSFSAPLTSYEAEYGKKNKVEIKFQTRSNQDLLTYQMTIFSNAVTSVRVTSNNRQAISYHGKLTLP